MKVQNKVSLFQANLLGWAFSKLMEEGVELSSMYFFQQIWWEKIDLPASSTAQKAESD